MKNTVWKKVVSVFVVLTMLGMPITNTQFGAFSLISTVYAEDENIVNLEYQQYEKFYFVKLPTTGNKKVSTDYEGTLINTFRIYDDNYLNQATQGCDGSLTIEAPEGWYIELSGIFSPGYKEGGRNDILKVYDGTDTNASVLYEVKSGGDYEKVDIGICKSTKIL